MAIPTYEQQPARLDGTVKLQGSDPVASALGELGGQVQNVGQMVAKIGEFKDQGFLSEAKVARLEKTNALSSGFDAEMAKPPDERNFGFSDKTPEHKAAFMEESMKDWEGGLIESWRGSKRALDDFQLYHRERSAYEQAAWHKEGNHFAMQKAVVGIKSEADVIRKEAIDAYLAGDEDQYLALSEQSDEVLMQMEGLISPEELERYRTEGTYSAAIGALSELQNVPQVVNFEESLDKIKAHLTPAQYAAVKKSSAALKNKMITESWGLIGKIADAIGKGEDVTGVVDQIGGQIEANIPDAAAWLENIANTGPIAEIYERTETGSFENKSELRDARNEGIKVLARTNQGLAKRIKNMTGSLRWFGGNPEDVDQTIEDVSASNALNQQQKAAIIEYIVSERKTSLPLDKEKRKFTAKEYDRLYNAYTSAVKASGEVGIWTSFIDDMLGMVEKGKTGTDEEVQSALEARIGELGNLADTKSTELRNASLMTGRQLRIFGQITAPGTAPRQENVIDFNSLPKAK